MAPAARKRPTVVMSRRTTLRTIQMVSFFSALYASSVVAFFISTTAGKPKMQMDTTFAASEAATTGNEDEPLDLFDYFDPLLSPHAYPDGISPQHKPYNADTTHTSTSDDTKDRGKTDIGFALPTTAGTVPEEQRQNQQQNQFSRSSKTPKDDNDLFDYFDPLLSPHAYPQGISPNYKPEELKSYEPSTKRVGILLMDHGSKKSASNARLQAMAALYQANMDEQYDYNELQQQPQVRSIIVKAAHMEIATPSIPDGLRALLDEGVDEIICHPFFLSPDGRHVAEDIPEIIDGAIQELQVTIPVITTEPVGANLDRMLTAVHSIVVDHSQILQQKHVQKLN